MVNPAVVSGPSSDVGVVVAVVFVVVAESEKENSIKMMF